MSKRYTIEESEFGLTRWFRPNGSVIESKLELLVELNEQLVRAEKAEAELDEWKAKSERLSQIPNCSPEFVVPSLAPPILPGPSRIQIAAMAMQGILSNPDAWAAPSPEHLAAVAIRHADALIAEASREEQQ